jgi:hypothetical protein
MSSRDGYRAATGVTLVLTCVLMATAGTSCSPGGAGSISVPGGKDKLKVISKIGPFKPKAGPAKPPQAAPRPR